MDWYSPEAAAEGNAVVPDKERAADQQLNANQLLASIPRSEEVSQSINMLCMTCWKEYTLFTE